MFAQAPGVAGEAAAAEEFSPNDLLQAVALSMNKDANLTAEIGEARQADGNEDEVYFFPEQLLFTYMPCPSPRKVERANKQCSCRTWRQASCPSWMKPKSTGLP